MGKSARQKKWLFVGLVITGIAAAGPARASAAAISLYVEPSKIYPNTANNPCIFYGPGNCSSDPSGWYDPAGPTGSGGDGEFSLTQLITPMTEWNSVVGSQFVIGLDANQDKDAQILRSFDIYFNDSSTAAYSYTGPTDIPTTNNGVGFADYVLAAGCLAVEDVPDSAFDRCTSFLPFVAPAGTTSITFQTSYFGNDGSDKFFALVEQCPEGGGDCSPIPFPDPEPLGEVPEPASLLLLGTGLMGLAIWGRARR